MADRRIRLVAFDMEGCLTADPTIWEIMHRKLGTWHSHGLTYWNNYKAGKLEYDDFARLDVATWRDAPLELLLDSAKEVPLTKGCAEVLSRLRAEGMQVAIISNGLTCGAARFGEEFGVGHIRANSVVVRGGRLTGELKLLVPYGAKGKVLAELARELHLEPSEIAAVGDSPADIAMFRAAAVSIAFRPSHPSVALHSSHTVVGDDLRPLLGILLDRTY